MKYRRIDEDTVQCIVTGDDLKEYGLSMSDIFERNERGEDFLRDLISEAHEEVGYTCKGNNIAMQISPFKDNGMVITFSENPENSFKNFLERMKTLLENAGEEDREVLGELADDILDHADGETEKPSDKKWNKGEDGDNGLGETRLAEFDTMNDVIAFAENAFGMNQIKSCLVKGESKYYLIMMKNRMSWKNYNKLSFRVYDFGKLVQDTRERLIYLGEHGELIIASGALNKLSRI